MSDESPKAIKITPKKSIELDHEFLEEVEFKFPYPDIFRFYEGTDPKYFSDLTGSNLNRAPFQLFENMKYFLMKVQAGDGSIKKSNRIEIVTELPKVIEPTTMYVIYEVNEPHKDRINKIWYREKEIDFTRYDTHYIDGTTESAPVDTESSKVSDLNKLTKPGIYFCSKVTNGPEGLDQFFLHVYATEDENDVYQVAIGFKDYSRDDLRYNLHQYLRFLKTKGTPSKYSNWCQMDLPAESLVRDYRDNTFTGDNIFTGTDEFNHIVSDQIESKSINNSGQITNPTLPIEDSHLANKGYVDGELELALSNLVTSTIGIPGKLGFGVGVYNLPNLANMGMKEVPGYSNPVSAAYGNYTDDSGSIMVFIPKFYYRIGHKHSYLYPTYGINTLEIAGIDTYPTTELAEADGFRLHEAFLDDGKEKFGFFIDKYLSSVEVHDDEVTIVSKRNKVPLSLGTIQGYSNLTQFEGLENNLSDAISLAKTRGDDYFLASVKMYSALSILELAHAQYSNYDIFNNWWSSDPDLNHMKGCNSLLADTKDPKLRYLSAKEQDSYKPLTGSANDLARVSHNGQPCGVIDINGCMDEVCLGITKVGKSATDATILDASNKDLYIIKPTTKISTLTQGFNGETDAFGDPTHLEKLYDKVISTITPDTTIVSNKAQSNISSKVSWGNVDNTVPLFHSDDSKVLDGILPPSDDSMSLDGGNLIGNDGIWNGNPSNLMMTIGGNWFNTKNAGIFCRKMNRSRSDFNLYTEGMRIARYPEELK